MRLAVRWTALCLLCCAGSNWYPATSEADLSSSPSEAAASPLDGPLLANGSPVEGEQLLAELEARRANPEAVAAREASRTEYQSLTSTQAR
ncbi:MAG: hypothetical protein ACYDHN_13870, partial [Solirubrobacteraceae bacterium]